jgi:hypothetical protein
VGTRPGRAGSRSGGPRPCRLPMPVFTVWRAQGGYASVILRIFGGTSCNHRVITRWYWDDRDSVPGDIVVRTGAMKPLHRRWARTTGRSNRCPRHALVTDGMTTFFRTDPFECVAAVVHLVLAWVLTQCRSSSVAVAPRPLSGLTRRSTAHGLPYWPWRGAVVHGLVAPHRRRHPVMMGDTPPRNRPQRAGATSSTARRIRW